MYTADEYYIFENLSPKGVVSFYPFANSTPPDSFRQRASDVILKGVLEESLAKINPGIPVKFINEVVEKVLQIASIGEPLVASKQFRKLLNEGIEVSFYKWFKQHKQIVHIVDPNNQNNYWMGTHQMDIDVNGRLVKSGIVFFLNGLPVVVMRLTNKDKDNVSLEENYEQLKMFQNMVPGLFSYNPILIVSDGTKGRYGSLTDEMADFRVWEKSKGLPYYKGEFFAIVHGLLRPGNLLEILLR